MLQTASEPARGRKVIRGHIAALDGLRAFAILAVIFHHCGEYFLVPTHLHSTLLRDFVGWLGNGVDLFFALSGFLITGILLDSLGTQQFFTRFYWRRGLRIWPLYYAFLFGAVIVHGKVFSKIGFAPFAFYYRNFLGPDPVSDIYIGQFWSLCVEEQFHLIWPIAIFFIRKRLRLPFILVSMAMALLFRIYLSTHGVNWYVVYRLPFCHMDVLLAGAAAAVLLRRNWEHRKLRRTFVIAAAAGFSGSMLLLAMPSGNMPYIGASLGITCTSLLFGGLVGLCAIERGTIGSKLLGNHFLRAISTRSYAMYVFHLVSLYVSARLLSRMGIMPLGVWAALAMISAIGIVTYGLAWISWHYFEEPILRLKKWEWFARPPMVDVSGVD